MLSDLGNALIRFSWQFSLAANTRRALASAWAASTAVVTDDAVVLVANEITYVLVAQTGGTTGSAPPSPASGTLVDGGVTWVVYRLPTTGPRCIFVTNTGATVATVGDTYLQLTPAPTSNGSAGPFPADPTNLFAVSTGTPTLVVTVSA